MGITILLTILHASVRPPPYIIYKLLTFKRFSQLLTEKQVATNKEERIYVYRMDKHIYILQPASAIYLTMYKIYRYDTDCFYSIIQNMFFDLFCNIINVF